MERAVGWSFAASEASLLSTVDRVNVEMCCTLSQMSHRHGGVWLYPSAFTRWNLKQVQKEKEVTNGLTGRCCCWCGDGMKIFFLVAEAWIRICGWWGTGGEGRVFLPGLAGGQACVRWLDWGTAEGNRNTGRWLVGGDSGSMKSLPVRNCSIVTSLVSVFFFFFILNIQACSFLSLYLHHRRTSRHCFPTETLVCVFSSQTIPPCSNRLPWAQTGSIHRISSPSYMRWNRTPLLNLLTESQLVSQPLASATLHMSECVFQAFYIRFLSSKHLNSNHWMLWSPWSAVLCK